MRIALSAINSGLNPGLRNSRIACLILPVSGRVTWTYCDPIRGCDDGPPWLGSGDESGVQTCCGNIEAPCAKRGYGHSVGAITHPWAFH